METCTLATLSQLLDAEGLLVARRNLEAAAATPITGADCDSRFAAAGHLFIAKGVAFKPAYLTSALERGAVAYLTDEARADELAAAAPQVPALIVNDVRRAMGIVSPIAWGHPDRTLGVVGITGTKGKTTTAYMLRTVLDAGSDAPRTAIMGSVETFDGIERAESVNTTPEAPDLWRHVANTQASGLPYLVMEVSSQALKYDRTLGLELGVACFLNLGRDHISPVEHPDEEDYFQSKLKIFSQAKVGVVNLSSDRAPEVLAAAGTCGRVVTFAICDEDASSASVAEADTGAQPTIWASDVTTNGRGMRFVAHTPSWEGPVALPLLGRFNVENALAAIVICEVLGIPREQVVAGLAQVSVPGRMEVIEAAGGKVVGVIDFAHNKMAFSRLLPAVRAQYPGRTIISVFGAVGSKAVERRYELPQEAAKWSDLLIFTEDDPGEEPVADICAVMEASTPEGTPCETILDRAEAVQRAVDLAFAEDGGAVVCLLCRGTEPTQHRGHAFVPVKLDAELFAEAVARHEA